MDMYKLKFTVLEQEIFSLLCKNVGKKLSQREIAKILNVSPTAVSKSVKRLLEKNLAKVDKIRNINFVYLNRDEQKAIELKRVENLKQIYLSGISDYLSTNLPGATIILFGSYAYGEDTVNSDIDIAIIGRKEKQLEVEKYKRILNRTIHLLFFESWREIKNRHLKNNILNGIVLHGGVEAC